MSVRWTDNALKHLLDIYEYISQNSPFYAQRMVDRLTKRSEQIAELSPYPGALSQSIPQTIYENL